MPDTTTSPAVTKLLRDADKVLVMARELQALNQPANAIKFAMFANEFVRAAHAMQDMEDASKAYDLQKSKRDRSDA